METELTIVYDETPQTEVFEEVSPPETEFITEPVPETEIPLETESEIEPETEPLLQADYTDLLVSIQDELVEVRGYLANFQNIGIPILCCVGLMTGILLALILTNYLKH